MVMGYAFGSEFIIKVLFIIWVITRVITIVISKKNGKKIFLGKEIMVNLFAIYIIMLIAVTLFPIEIILDKEILEEANNTFLNNRFKVNLIPFNDYYLTFKNMGMNTFSYYFFRGLIGNVILLVPFIGYLCMYIKKIRSIKNVIIVSVLISLSIELLQLIQNITFISGGMRIVTIDDLILNTIGGVIGYYLFNIIYKTKLTTYFN